jgi:hypothetical protein
MTELAPLLRDQRKTDAGHLQLLSIFHFILAGMAVAGIGFLALHYVLLNSIFSNPEIWKSPKGGGGPPAEFFAIFRWVYVVIGVALVAGSLANLLSGLFLRKRKYRTFSLVVAGIDCIQIPFGTVLGIFTIIVLLRDSVRELYES